MKNTNILFKRIIVGCVSATIAFVGCAETCFAAGNTSKSESAIRSVKISAENFPDANFRVVISGRDYDRDGNGVLSKKRSFC